VIAPAEEESLWVGAEESIPCDCTTTAAAAAAAVAAEEGLVVATLGLLFDDALLLLLATLCCFSSIFALRILRFRAEVCWRAIVC
jgi:hypothetical protein